MKAKATYMDVLIVTRHTGAVEWLRRQGVNGDVLAHVTADDVRGRVVIGALPLHLAAEAARVGAIDMPNLPPDQRGQDLTAEEMDAAGASISWYQIRRVGAPDLMPGFKRTGLIIESTRPLTREELVEMLEKEESGILTWGEMTISPARGGWRQEIAIKKHGNRAWRYREKYVGRPCPRCQGARYDPRQRGAACPACDMTGLA